MKSEKESLKKVAELRSKWNNLMEEKFELEETIEKSTQRRLQVKLEMSYLESEIEEILKIDGSKSSNLPDQPRPF